MHPFAVKCALSVFLFEFFSPFFFAWLNGVQRCVSDLDPFYAAAATSVVFLSLSFYSLSLSLFLSLSPF
jgi:hypothetical protein